MKNATASWPVEWWRTGSPTPTGARHETSREQVSADPGAVLPFRALVGFTVIMLLAPQEFFPVLAPFRLALVAAACAGASHLLQPASRRTTTTAFRPEMTVCALLVAWTVVMVPFSTWPGGSVGVLFNLYLKSVIVFWLLAGIIRSTHRLRQMAWVLSLIAGALALTGVSHFASGTFSAAGALESRIVGYDAGLVRNPNDLALVLNLILPFTVALLFSAESGRARIALGAIVAVEVVGVFATFSRSGFVTLAAIGALFLWRLRGRRGSGWLWCGLVALVVSLPLLPGAYLERLSTIVNSDSDPTGSAQSRWADQLVAIDYISDHPLIGAGAGNDILVLNERRGALWTQVHNTYLEYGVDLGLPGLGLFVALLWLCLKAVNDVSARCLKAGDAPVLLALADGVWVSLAAFAVAALFYPVAYHVYFYYMAGLAMAVKATAHVELAS